jgi:hypothetical protein
LRKSVTFFSQPPGSLCFAPMYFLIAGSELPLRSLRPAMASRIISAYVGCSALGFAALAAFGLAAGTAAAGLDIVITLLWGAMQIA